MVNFRGADSNGPIIHRHHHLPRHRVGPTTATDLKRDCIAVLVLYLHCSVFLMVVADLKWELYAV